MRKLSLLLLACLTLGIAWAERVSVNTAQQVAANVAAGLSPSNLRSSSDLKLVYAAPAKQQSGLRSADNESDYYIFNVGTGDGFIIVAGEDRVRPVLGYSAEGEVDMEKMPENMKAWLEMYQGEIGWAVSQGLSASDETQAEWQGLLNGTTKLRASKPQLETAHWAQGKPFNGMTPTINGEHAVTGCVATAQAIVMKYYEYPQRAIGGVSSYDEISITYDDYDWDNMLLDYSDGYTQAQGDAVAKLMWHCGANVGMEYGVQESGASTNLVTSSLKNVFGYSQSVQYAAKQAYRWADWTALIKKEIDEQRPLILHGSDPLKGGHAFVCDGYNSNDYFHINWGWGNAFGYYVLSTLDDNGDGYGFAYYEDRYGAIIGIQPEGGEPADIPLYISNISYGGSIPLPTYVSVSVSYEYTALEIIPSCWIGLAVIDEDGTIIQKPTYHTEHTTWTELGVYYSGKRGYTIDLEEPLTEGQRIVVVHSTDEGANWKITKVGAVSPLGLDKDGLIIQGPDNPEDQEEPVNMSVVWNNFDDEELEVITDGRTNSYTNTKAFSLRIIGLETNAWMGISVNEPESWIGHLRIYYGSDYTIDQEGAGTLATAENGKWWIPVALDDLENNYWYQYLKVLPDKAGIINYNIELWSEDQKTLLAEIKDQQMRTVGAEEPTQPITWTFDPAKLEGLGGAEQWFSIKATNVGDYVGKKPMISLNIEGSLSDEVAVSYVTSDFIPKPLEVTKHPDWEDSNLCITTPYEVEALEEGKEYQFIFRYIGGFVGDLHEYGDIQLESVTIDGTELTLDPNARVEYDLTAPEVPIEVVDGEVLYDESHAGKTVNVYSDGIYVVNEPNASIKDLHIQPGGQVRLLQQLEVGQLYLSHDIPTDKWTTFAVPQSSQNIMIGDGHDEILAEGSLMAGRKGYTSADDQMWTPQYEASFVPGTAVLLANANGGGLVGFHNEEFYNETLTPMTLPVRPYTEIDGNQPNGTWFHFVANPLWENLQINGRAYVLDETGLNFALRENPTIKPFEAYMIASDEVMDNVSNLRIGGIPTSNEEMMATGFRAWSESGHICFETTEAKDVAIYSMTGVQLQRIERSVGTKRVALNQGIYIVVCDGTAYKVSVK